MQQKGLRDAMAMKSLEDLERAFDRGLNAWEREIVTKHANQMGQKLVKSIKSKTPVITGNLRRRWTSEVNAGKGDVLIEVKNDAEYAAWVNNGHRLVSHGKTIGKVDGKHMLERGIEEYKSRYLKDDLEGMVKALNAKMKG